MENKKEALKGLEEIFEEVPRLSSAVDALGKRMREVDLSVEELRKDVRFLLEILPEVRKYVSEIKSAVFLLEEERMNLSKNENHETLEVLELVSLSDFQKMLQETQFHTREVDKFFNLLVQSQFPLEVSLREILTTRAKELRGIKKMGVMKRQALESVVSCYFGILPSEIPGYDF